MERIERIGPPGTEPSPVAPVQRLAIEERERQARERERRRRRPGGQTTEPQPEDPGDGHVDVRA
jgi:hypothetical protein